MQTIHVWAGVLATQERSTILTTRPNNSELFFFWVDVTLNPVAIRRQGRSVLGDSELKLLPVQHGHRRAKRSMRAPN